MALARVLLARVLLAALVAFRNLGIPAYGANGVFVSEGDMDRMHGRDERISVRAFGRMVRWSEALLAAAANFALRPGESSGGTLR